jgi:hypothetical protein
MLGALQQGSSHISMRIVAILLAMMPVAAQAMPVLDRLGRLDGGDIGLVAIGFALSVLLARRRRGLPESAD